MIESAGVEPDARVLADASGDREAFHAVVGPHLRAIHLHCYRMLGSYHDAEEASQEVLLRAWRSLPGFEGRAPLRHWLYRIATTTCLKVLARRARQATSVADLTELEPYPDRLLDELAPGQDPAAEVQRRESVALAFVVALQLLPATQRAVLILRDVLTFSATEVAEVLGSSVAAVNSALQRARATLRTGDACQPPRPLEAVEQHLVSQFMDAWHRCDIPALSALLREDVILRMPPEPVEFHGRIAVADFFATVPADGHLDRLPLRVTAANGQPALAAYDTVSDGPAAAYGLMVLTITDGAIAAITGFRDPALFHAFGLPATLG
ncbi:MAG: RNA polymerase subunit sigma-70 [Actinobacteria bacterium]|nr:RNA polymerase subunit sigma-70 [Actinomycetota bacterium]MBI3687896.1 RNA polymerase subunit sigma-70 [Actinomycetota bacterium]